MSKKEKALKTQREAEVMQTAGVPTQKTDGVGVVMATEIIADLKKQLEEAKEDAKDWEESWNVCREQGRVLSRQSDIISMALRMDDLKLLDLAFGFVRGCYNQQIKKEQEAENNGEV
nr:MAG TPA: hypothetical protein [Caudoviricetes sp.]